MHWSYCSLVLSHDVFVVSVACYTSATWKGQILWRKKMFETRVHPKHASQTKWFIQFASLKLLITSNLMSNQARTEASLNFVDYGCQQGMCWLETYSFFGKYWEMHEKRMWNHLEMHQKYFLCCTASGIFLYIYYIYNKMRLSLRFQVLVWNRFFLASCDFLRPWLIEVVTVISAKIVIVNGLELCGNSWQAIFKPIVI